MKKLTDYHPLSRVTLPDVGDLPNKGLTVLVGPNSSGKSQLLRDIHLTITGQPRQLVVAARIEIAKPPDLGNFLSCLEAEGFVRRVVDASGTKFIRPITANVGQGEAANQVPLTDLEQQFVNFAPDQVPSVRGTPQFLPFVGRMLVAALFLERRLIAVNQVGMFDYETTPPQNDLHALYIHETAQTDLLKETLSVFSKAVWPDASRGSTLSLRVADEPDAPTMEKRLLPATSARYRSIDTEGDGLKSYVAVCIALLVGRRPVCLIDEPEMCLHPPQAESLGRFIGAKGTSPDHATIVATHSSHILRGILQRTTELRIVRLRRVAGRFRAHNVSWEDLRAVLARPTVRADAILDGIFAEAVMIVEADSDRMVYQAAWRTIRTPADVDVHFAPVGGTGGISDPTRLYRKLKIPVAIIADLDVLSDGQRFRTMVESLATNKDMNRLLALAEEVVQGLKQQRPSYTPDQAHESLAEMSRRSLDWTDGGDLALSKELRQLAGALDRMSRLKRGGVRAVDKSLRRKLCKLIREARCIGLFLVHVGELENWLRREGLMASKERKAEWAMEAAVVLESRGPGKGDVWKFVRDATRYLSEDPSAPEGRLADAGDT
jgi:hypothetical protein